MKLREIFKNLCLAVPVARQEFQNAPYEKAGVIVPPDEARFFQMYESTVEELMVMFRGHALNKELGTEIIDTVPDNAWVEDGYYWTRPAVLDDDDVLLPGYEFAVIDNMLYLMGLGDTYKTEFIRKARAAYLSDWGKNAKGRRLKRLRW